MTINYNIEQISDIVKGKLILSDMSDAVIKHLLTDSRQIVFTKNCLFFALTGRNNNGHKYIKELYNKGIKNFVISSVPSNIKKFKYSNFILVKDTLKALQILTSFHRKNFDIPVIGITGSNGKTIVKEWLYQIMCEDKKIIRNPKSYNSQTGVPLSVWKIKPEFDFAVFEAGISKTGEMEKLQDIINPTIGIFTTIGDAHSENFVNTKQKINEKLKLFKNVNILIYCSDYDEIKEQIARTLKNINCFSWSKKNKGNLNIQKISKNDYQTNICAFYNKKNINITIPFTDDASIENAIHCLATMLYLGYDNNIISQRMKVLTSVAMRLELKQGINNCSIINDSYNSDINSLSIAIDFLNQQKQHKKKTIILSDILQSGRNEEDLYNEVSKLISNKGIDRIIGIGKAIKRQYDKFKVEKVFFDTTDDFLNNFSFSSFYDETILIKGARIYKFELISKALEQKTHETILEINLSAIIHNLNYYRSLLKPDTKITAIVKAFSYGSGSFEIANILQFHNIDYLAVAYTDEGVELRKAGISVPIIIMNPESQSFDMMIKYDLEPEIYNLRLLNLLSQSIKRNLIRYNKIIPIHIKLDTGMHRLGFEDNQLKELIQCIKNNKNIYIKSIFSHLAASDEPMYDDFTKLQVKRFVKMSDFIKSQIDYPVFLHILNSSGVSRFREYQFDMVRLGIGLYGVSPDKSEKKLLQNVSSLKTSISQIREVPANETIGYGRKYVAKYNMKIATVGIGYADGLNRKLSNGKGKLMVNGKLVPIVGNICMDMCMIDITDVNAKQGDQVIVFDDNYPVTEIASQLQTIPYEVLTSVPARVKRVYYKE
jgi:alanine racemase